MRAGSARSVGVVCGELTKQNPAGVCGRGFVVLVVERPHVFGRPGSDLLSQALRLSTIGAKEFNGRVRDGIGFWAPRNYHQIGEKHAGEFWFHAAGLGAWQMIFDLLGADRFVPAASNTCGYGLMRTIKPIELLVLVSFTPRGASTSSLSTWWSSTALKGMLVLKEASCLDAFSSYPVRI